MTDVLAVGDSGPRPDDHRPEVSRVLEMVEQVWNGRDLKAVEDFIVHVGKGVAEQREKEVGGVSAASRG